jgi:hypothetical protein
VGRDIDASLENQDRANIDDLPPNFGAHQPTGGFEKDISRIEIDFDCCVPVVLLVRISTSINVCVTADTTRRLARAGSNRPCGAFSAAPNL